MVHVRPEAFEDRRQLGNNVRERQVFLIELGSATLTKPHKGIKLRGLPFTLNDQSYRVGRTLRRMGRPGRQKEHVPFVDMHITGHAVVNNLDGDVPFQLIEQLFAFVVVVVLPGIGSTDDHHDEFGVFVDLGIADRWL